MPIKYISRANDITTQLKKKSVLLLGPRRTGKSAFIRNELQPDHSYNLLQADTFQELSHRPSILRTVREYFAILEDTLMGHNLEPFRPQKLSRKSVSTSKFYFFDLGVLNALVQRKAVNPASVEYGELFETLIFLELKAYIDAKGLDTKLNFWRSHTGQEVDFVVNDAIGIEVKATPNISERHMEGLAVLHKQIPLKRRFIVAHDKHSRQIGGVEVLHWRDFLEMLWDGLVVG